MGQMQVLNMLKQSSDSSLFSSKATSKVLSIESSGKIVKISFLAQSTIGFVISELNRLSRKENIVALASKSKNETLDFYLTLYDKLVEDLPENETFLPVSAKWPAQKIDIMNYQPIKIIGKGGFSLVTLARKNDSGQLFAVKTIEKALVAKRKKNSQAVVEQEILMKLNHPFIVALHASFQTVRFI
jgi:hypothetical protein